MECKDRNCPKHGTLSTRGQVLEGVVVSDKMQSTVIVKRERFVKVRKYSRYRKSTSKIPAHNPHCMSVKVGDKVRIKECRKLSKTKSFVITEVIGQKDSEKKQDKTKKQEKDKKPVKKTEEVDSG
jgi:small subunit ribosomal protein S17